MDKHDLLKMYAPEVDNVDEVDFLPEEYSEGTDEARAVEHSIIALEYLDTISSAREFKSTFPESRRKKNGDIVLYNDYPPLVFITKGNLVVMYNDVDPIYRKISTKIVDKINKFI